MRYKNLIFSFLMSIFVSLSFVSFVATASGTKVGNGDNGGDLEDLQPVQTGILQETRQLALAKVRSLHTSSVPYLGNLVAEIQNTQLYLAKEDKTRQYKLDKGLESSPDGEFVYARTFARPHAVTRFFPAALRLTQDQLIALHIHEALHRSLPPPANEDEELVTLITLAMTVPEATNDAIRETVEMAMRPYQMGPTQSAGNGSESLRSASLLPELKEPNLISYQYRVFNQDPELGLSPLLSMHSIKSYLHPFGQGPNAIGLGLEFTFLNLEDQNMTGPLGLSGRMRLLTFRGFDVDAWGLVSIATGEESELMQSHFGASHISLGLSMKKAHRAFFVENSVILVTPSDARQLIGGFEYNHQFGSIVKAQVAAGLDLGIVDVGGFVELAVAEGYKLEGPGLPRGGSSSGRFRLLSVGPEVGLSFGPVRAGLSGRFILDKNKDTNFDYLGDLLGSGAGQGSIASQLTVRF